MYVWRCEGVRRSGLILTLRLILTLALVTWKEGTLLARRAQSIHSGVLGSPKALTKRLTLTLILTLFLNLTSVCPPPVPVRAALSVSYG